jgi:hypothetical protein
MSLIPPAGLPRGAGPRPYGLVPAAGEHRVGVGGDGDTREGRGGAGIGCRCFRSLKERSAMLSDADVQDV